MWLLRRTSNVLEKIDLLPSSTTIISLEGDNSASFVTEISIEKYDSVLFKDVMGKWQEYIVRSVEDDGLTKKVYAEHAIFELHDQYIKDMRPTEGTTALRQLTSILSNTRWSVGLVNVGGAPENFFYYISVYDAMKTLADKVGGELSYEIEIQNNQITQRKVNLVDRLGGDYGYIFTYDNNLLGVTKTVLDDDIYTALIGRGQGEQISENGWGRRLTLEDIDKPDSPLGENYVEDVAARDLYGLRSTSDPSTKIHRVATVEFDDVTDVEELYLLTKEMLQRINQPEFNYKVNIMLLDNMVVALGDDIRVVDLEFGGNRLALYGRVTSIQYDLLYPENTQVTIGNIKNDMSGFQKEIENQVAFFRSKSSIWDRANAFDETNHLSASYIRDLLDEWNAKANASGGYTYTIDGGGSITYDRAIDDNPTKALQIVGGTMRIANSKDPQGNWIWRTAITADGVAGQEILANSITANQLRSDVGANLDLSSNQSINLVVTNVIDDLDFQDGASAYEIAVANGFSGTQTEWLASLKGQDGTSVTIKGSKETTAQLPTSNNTIGDSWVVDGYLWAWTENGWTNVGRFQGQNGKDGIGYQLILTGDDTLFFNENNSSSTYYLRASVYVNNQNVTTSIPATNFVWRRYSAYPSQDTAFNNQGKTGRNLALSPSDLSTSATYEVELSIPDIQGYLLDNDGNYITDFYGNKIVVNSSVLVFKQQINVSRDLLENLNALSAEITVMQGKINLKASMADIDGNYIASQLNISPSEVKIQSPHLALEGLTTINGKVQITQDGRLVAVDGSFSGVLEANQGNIGGFTIADDGLRKSFTKTFGPFVQSDYQTLLSIVQNRTQPTSAQLNKFDINGDGVLNAFDLVRLSRILNGHDPNPYTVTFTIKLNTQDHRDMISLINSTSPSNSTSIGTQGIKTPTVFTNNIENLNKITTLSEGNFTIVDSKGDNLFRSGKDSSTGAIMATIPNLATGNLWANTVNSVRIVEVADGFYLLAKTGKLIGINQTGVYAGTTSSTKYIHTF